MIINAIGEDITIKHESDVEPLVVSAQELLEVIAEKFPEKVLEIVKFMKECTK